jgi:hypothetical protein
LNLFLTIHSCLCIRPSVRLAEASGIQSGFPRCDLRTIRAGVLKIIQPLWTWLFNLATNSPSGGTSPVKDVVFQELELVRLHLLLIRKASLLLLCFTHTTFL